jgi:hypothetical protein
MPWYRRIKHGTDKPPKPSEFAFARRCDDSVELANGIAERSLGHRVGVVFTLRLLADFLWSGLMQDKTVTAMTRACG